MSTTIEQRFGIELPYTMTLRVRGVRPLLFNRMDIEAYDQEGGPASKRKPRARPEYESMVWRTEAGELGMPVRNLIGSIIGAGKYYKSPIAGNGSATPTLRDGLVEAAELGSFGVTDWDSIDFRQARYGDIKGTPKPTYRPRLETGWCFAAELVMTTPELYGPAKLLEVISRAGAVMGIGDGRKIGFGRYVIDGYDLAEGLPWRAMPDDPPCLTAALAYAARGWPTFPLKPHAKEPITRRGVKDATLDDVQLRRWFDRWPQANVAIACGAPGPQALDIDDLEAGRGALAIATGLGGPDVATARGRQFYLQGSSSSTIGLGWGELRGVGSYVVAPPSIHPTGKLYTFLVEPTDAPLPRVPAELVPVRVATAGAGEMAAVALIPHGQRHEALKDAAIRMVRSGIVDVATLELMLRSFFAARCDRNPKPRRDEFLRIAEWAASSEIAHRERAFVAPVEGKPTKEAGHGPGPDATLTEHRAFLRRMGGWGHGVDVEAVRRKGGRLVDALEIVLTNGQRIAFDRQEQITSRGHWQRAVIAGTNGIACPPGLKEAQLFDVYRSLCVLADTPPTVNDADELADTIADYLGTAEALTDHDLGEQADRYDVIARCRARAPYDPFRAHENPPVVIVDQDGSRYVRAGELQGYLRRHTDLSIGMIPGRLEALGLERVALYGRERGRVDERGRRTNHMVIYRIPAAL